MDNATLRWWQDYWGDRADGGWPEEETGGDVERVYRNQARILSLLLEDCPVGRMLELGCGSGRLLDHLNIAEGDYSGVDIRAPMIDALRLAHPAAHLYVDDASTFRVGETFDTIVSFGVVQQFDEAMLRNHLGNAHGMLARDGILIIGDFAWRSYRMQQMGSALLRVARARTREERRLAKIELDVTRKLRAYSRSQVIALAAEARLTVEFFGSFAVPGYLTARVRRADR